MRRVLDPVWGPLSVYVCASCGEEFFITDPVASSGYGPVDAASMTRLILGDPPRCADCRGVP